MIALKHLLITTLISIVAFVQAQSTSGEVIQLKNIKVTPDNVAQPGSEIINISDGKNSSDNTIFHSKWGGIKKEDIIIEADMTGKNKKLDVITLYPRLQGYNGIITKADIWVKKNNKYNLVAKINTVADNAPVKIELKKPIQNPEKIKIVVKDTYNEQDENIYMVSLGELECRMLGENEISAVKIEKDAQIFGNLTATKLKHGVSIKSIEKMKLPLLKDYALRLYKNEYSPVGLIANYPALEQPSRIAKRMRIGNGFSQYEGITGVYLEAGDNIVFVGKTNGCKVKLLVPNWTRKAPEGIKPQNDPAGWGLKSESFSLQEGTNIIHLSKAGNVYVQYFVDDNPGKYPEIEVHFPNGKVNGYFDTQRGDNDEYFNKLLDNAVSPIMDMRGKYAQIAFPVESLKKYTHNKGTELVNNYDTIIGLQRYLCGWTKEGFVPKNHFLARINYHYYMFRDGDGVAFIDWAMKMVANPASVIEGDPCWGFSHEIGHIHQMRPQMTWGGMGEVSNNIFTLFCTTSLGNTSRLSTSKTYAKAKSVILDKGISYMDFPGKHGDNTNQYGGDGNTDVFQRLVPFWQLHLYFSRKGYTDFYPDVMIALRKQPPFVEKNKSYLNMLEFCRMACLVSKTDLTEFFERWGFFYVGEIDVQDYGQYTYNVTKEDIEKTKSDIAKMGFQKPDIDITQLED